MTQRASQPYVAVRGVVTMATFPAIADRFGEVFGFLAARGVAPAGPPFFRYLTIDMDGDLEVEAAVPVAAAVAGDGAVVAGELPGGDYATLTHVGPPDQLVARTAELLAWAQDRGLAFDVQGERWGGRLEELLTHPAEVPDTQQWVTRLVFRLAD